MCRRRWIWDYRLDFESPLLKPTEAGKRTHALLEECKDEEPYEIEPWEDYDISRMARALWRHNPQDEAIGFEVEFLREIFGLPFKGVIDRLSVGHILDWKTTGGSLKYAKTPAALKKNIQRLVYSTAYPETPYSLWVTGTWGNSEGALRAGDVVPYETRASLLRNNPEQDAEAFKQYVLRPAEEIALVPAVADPFDYPLPDNAFAPFDSPCKKFQPKGCPHYGKCHATKSSFRSALAPKVAPVSVLETIRVPEPVSLPIVEVKPAPPEFLIENLYVDCMPLFTTDEPLVYALQELAKAANEVEADKGLHHVMLADYSRGGPFLAVELCAQLELKAPIKHFYLETKSAEGRGVMQTLMGRSRRVYKGMF